MANEKYSNEENKILQDMKQLLQEENNLEVEKNWRFLPSNIRLELLSICFRSKNEYFLNKEHFKKWFSDIEMLRDAVNDSAQEFKLSEPQLYKIRRSFRGEKFDGNEARKNVALYMRLSEYRQLSSEFDVLSPQFISENDEILLCDSRVIRSRVCFLLELNNGNIIDMKSFREDLLARRSEFNRKYQIELEKLMVNIDRNGDYQAIASIVDLVPDYAYDKFLELSLRAMYGDDDLLNQIEKRKLVWQQSQSSFSSGEKLEARESEETQISEEDRRIIAELFREDIIPTKEQSSGENVILEHSAESEEQTKNHLDEVAIQKYIDELSEMGISCGGAITSRSVLKEDKIRYYIFEAGQYKVLEPIGQVGHCTLVVRSDSDLEQFNQLIQNNTQSDLITQGIAFRVNHRRTENKEYMYSPMRLKNLIQLIQEGRKEPNHEWGREKIQAEITKEIPSSEIPEVIEYITEFTRQTAYNVIKKVRNVEERYVEESYVANSSGEEVKPENLEEVDI